ncbi:MAG TPA: metal-dependent hydrolase [Thermoanaerobaculia bacterium]|nr:metal-dependent hydrolase [Thermoanaerobaculia bacterium]
MDPLTHTLVGANLGATRLADKTRLAAAACVIGANLPDIDSILYFTGHDDLALGFRRGWTHGVLALLVLPFLQTALLLAYDKLRPHPTRKASARWLLAVSFLAILTHPFLDWLNNYGMRWLMPFRGTWFYGDSVYIMDPWLWLILGCGWLAPRRASWWSVGALAIVAALLANIVAKRSTDYLPVVVLVAVVLLATLLWRPRATAHRFAVIALILASAYIAVRLTIHAYVANEVRRETSAAAVMAAPHPIDPTRWDIVVRTGDHYRYGRWLRGRLNLAEDRLPVAKPSPEWTAAQNHPSIRGFVTWMRFPWYEVERTPTHTRILVHDARYAVRRRAGGGFGGVVVEIPHSERKGPHQ